MDAWAVDDLRKVAGPRQYPGVNGFCCQLSETILAILCGTSSAASVEMTNEIEIDVTIIKRKRTNEYQ